MLGQDSGDDEPVRRRRHRAPELVELHADGFVAGEDIAVAVILGRGSAGPGGHVRALIDRAEIALLGRISGAIAIRHVTSQASGAGLAPCSVPGGCRGHSSTSRAWRSRGSAFGNEVAICSSVDGEFPRRRSQRRSASWATSLPSWCMSRKQSTMVLSAE